MFLFSSDSLLTESSSPTMSFIQAFLQQTVYLGMPDDSVRNSVVLFQLLVPTTLFFSFFSLPVVCLGGKSDQAVVFGVRKRRDVIRVRLKTD